VRGGLPVVTDMPHVGGSDVAGVVVEAGAGVDAARIGERVVVNPSLWCGECEWCRRGEESMCLRYRIIGEHTDGGFTESLAVPADHAYRLPGTGDLPQNSIQRLPLVDPAEGVPCERRYETRAPIGGWVPPHPIVEPGAFGDSGEQPVTASVRFANRKSGGLGIPLPAGRVRVFDDGELLGEAAIGHTPADRELAMTVGTVFDLTATRKRVDFDVDRAGRTMTERVQVTLHNAKAQAATVHVVVPLPRWSDWEIVESTVPAKKEDAQTASFAVEVPAGGERVLEYTVRYRWAPDVQVP
jgi:hypothetical protein